MNKHYLQSKVKSIGTAYLLWFFFGFHYGYLGKWGIQILYWVTLGGIGIWALIDLFTMSGKVDRHNAVLFQQIDEIEKKEKESEHARNMAMIVAANSTKKSNEE